MPENPIDPVSSAPPRHAAEAPPVVDPAAWVVERLPTTRSVWSPPESAPLPPPAPPSVQPSPARPWIIALVVVSTLALLVGGTAGVGALAAWTTNSGGVVSEDIFDEDPSLAFGEKAVYGEYVGLLDFTGVRSHVGLRKGTCFTVADLDAEYVGVVVARSCDAPHDKEAYASTTIPGDDFPGYLAIGARVYATCERAFADYVGADYDESGADFGGLAPTERGWADGERDLVCFTFFYDDEHTGSLRDSGL